MKLSWSVLPALFASFGVFAQSLPQFDCTLERQGEIKTIARTWDEQLIVGGRFDAVNGVPRQNIARLRLDGTLDTNWNPNADGEINALAIYDTNIYVGGGFTVIGGTNRAFLAKLDPTTGRAVPNWTNDADGPVYALALEGLNLVVGGAFTKIGGQNQRGITKISALTGHPDINWTNGVTYNVSHLLVYGSDIFVGGLFTNIGATGVRNLAKVLSFNGQANTNWDPKLDRAGSVFGFAHVGSALYVCGLFTNMGGQTRNGLAKLNDATGAIDLSWNPDGKGYNYLRCLAADTLAIYVGGTFTNLGGTNCQSLARLNTTTGAADPTWTNRVNNNPYALLSANITNLYVGGDFDQVNGRWGPGLAFFNPSTGRQFTNFTPVISSASAVKQIARQADGQIIVGGSFERVNGMPRKYLARLYPNGQLDTNWLPVLNDNATLHAICVYQTNIYIGGTFTNIGGTARSLYAKLDPQTGALLPGWAPPAVTGYSYSPFAIVADASGVYIGGKIGAVGGVRTNLAKVSHATGALDPAWQASCDSEIYALQLDGTSLYAGGSFNEIGGVARTNAAKLDRTTGAVDPAWDPAPDSYVYDLDVYGTGVYLVGEFHVVGGQPRTHAAKVSANNGTVDPNWRPNPSSYTYAVTHDASWIYLGGEFEQLQGTNQPYLVRVNPFSGAADPNWNPAANERVEALKCDGTNLLAAGFFTRLCGWPRISLAPLQPFQAGAIQRLTNGWTRFVWRSRGDRRYALDIATNAGGSYAQIASNLVPSGELTLYTDRVVRAASPAFFRLREVP